MRRRFRGFTLMELMMVVALSVIIMTPAYRIFKSGSQASLQGMQQIDMVRDGRQIIRKIHNDLKMSCREMSAAAFSFTFNQMVAVTPGSSNSIANTKYVFLIFPLHAEVSDAVSEKAAGGKAPRFANRVTYTLEPSGKPDMPFLKLVREEKFHPQLGGKTLKTVYSERVNYFSIKPVEIQSKEGKNQWFFNVTLQLAEARHPKELGKATNNLQLNRSNGLIIADFFDVVYPEFFSALNNQDYMGRNWYTVIEGPP